MNQAKPALTEARTTGMVRQANVLVKSAQTMELNEKRLIMLAMSRIRWGDAEFLTQDIPVTELAQWLGGNPYQEGRKAADGLLHRIVEVLEDGGEQSKFQWTTLSAYIPAHKHKAGVACVRIRFNEELAPFLLQLRDRYNQIPLTHMLPMPSFNSQRLYEILWHDSHAGTKKVLSYGIDQLKIFIGLKDLHGKWEKYKTWKDFKKVLEKAVEDFNTHGSLKISSYTGQRQTQRSYSHVLFHLSKVERTERSKSDNKELDPELLAIVGELERAGYTQDPFGTVQTYGAEVVKHTLALAKEAEHKAAQTNKPIYNVGGLIASMLKQGVAVSRVVDGSGSPKLSNHEMDRHARELVDAYQTALTEHLNEVWAALPETEQEDVHARMNSQLNRTLLDYLDSVSWQGRGYASLRNSFMADELVLPHELTSLRAFNANQGLLQVFGQDEQKRILKRAESFSSDPGNN